MGKFLRKTKMWLLTWSVDTVEKQITPKAIVGGKGGSGDNQVTNCPRKQSLENSTQPLDGTKSKPAKERGDRTNVPAKVYALDNRQAPDSSEATEGKATEGRSKGLRLGFSTACMEGPPWPPPATGGTSGGTAASRSFADVIAGSCRLEPSVPDLGRCATHRGEPALLLSQNDLHLLSTPFKNALVGRFPFRRPPMEAIRGFFVSLGLKGDCDVGLLDLNHVLIRPSTAEDFTRLFVRRSWFVKGAQMLVSKWTLDFKAHQDSTFAPVWVSMPALPLPLFNSVYIAKLAGMLRRCLKIDSATVKLKRPSVARVLIEMDVSKQPPHRIWIEEDQEGFWQEVEYESWPKFCGFCARFGHDDGEGFRQHPDLKPVNRKVTARGNTKEVYRAKGTIDTNGPGLGLLKSGECHQHPEALVAGHSNEGKLVPGAMGRNAHVEMEGTETAEQQPAHNPASDLQDPKGASTLVEAFLPSVAVEVIASTEIAGFLTTSGEIAANESPSRESLEELHGGERVKCGNNFAVLQSLSDLEVRDVDRIFSSSACEGRSAKLRHRRQCSDGDIPGEAAPWEQLKHFQRVLHQRLSAARSGSSQRGVEDNVEGLEQPVTAEQGIPGARHKGGRPARADTNQETPQLEVVRRFLGFDKALGALNNKAWVLWYNEMSLSFREMAEQLLHMNIVFSSGCSLQFSAVYARCSRVGRRELWAAMESLAGEVLGPWLLAGDFNVISCMEERVGGAPANEANMEEFNESIGNCGLSEVPFDGAEFTWTNGRMWQRLDRALMNQEWVDGYDLSHVSHLARGRSDHAPLLICCQNGSPSKRSFKFLSVWRHHTGFKDVVQKSWEMPAEGEGMTRFYNKLRAVKGGLQVWNAQVFGNIFNKVKAAEAVLKQREEEFDNGRGSVSRAALEEAKAVHARSLAEECEYWRQKAGIRWLQDLAGP
ncbi:uncharacterized protein [Coffea arabica]|uniref:DUF4283 domain-containing protein n=1 Tax=Coffea arabica TaxID=13443 RepID=A0ABM4UR43_COFAR